MVVGFATARTVVGAIRDGRGFDDAAAVLGAGFDGVLVLFARGTETGDWLAALDDFRNWLIREAA